MEFPEPQVSMLQNQHSPPHCCYLLHPGPWTVSSHWGSEHLYGGKQCRHPHFSGEELSQKGRDTCSRPHGWWVGVRPLNVCCQPCWGASSFLSWAAPPPHTHLPTAMWPTALPSRLLTCLLLETGAWADGTGNVGGKPCPPGVNLQGCSLEAWLKWKKRGVWLCVFTTVERNPFTFFCLFYHFFLYNASRNAPQWLEPQNKMGGEKKNTCRTKPLKTQKFEYRHTR